MVRNFLIFLKTITGIIQFQRKWMKREIRKLKECEPKGITYLPTVNVKESERRKNLVTFLPVYKVFWYTSFTFLCILIFLTLPVILN